MKVFRPDSCQGVDDAGVSLGRYGFWATEIEKDGCGFVPELSVCQSSH